MCHCQQEQSGSGTAGGCSGREGERWLSRKKQTGALRERLAYLENQAEDIREYLRELEG
jgi:hypothetical protein